LTLPASVLGFQYKGWMMQVGEKSPPLQHNARPFMAVGTLLNEAQYLRRDCRTLVQVMGSVGWESVFPLQAEIRQRGGG